MVSDLNSALSTIQNCGLNPKLIIDVGAHSGTWTSPVQDIFPDAEFLLIEPQDLPITNKLNSKNFTWLRIG